MARSRGYSSSSTFNFEIERYFCPETKQYLLEKELPETHSEEEITSKFEYQTITLEVSGNSWHSPGEYSRLPEDCYPDDGDTEIDSIIGPDGQDWYNLLSSEELQDVYSELQSRCESSSGDYSDYDGSDYNKWESFDRYGY
jgi:hypothetical protein